MALQRVIHSDDAPVEIIRQGDTLIQKPREANPVLTISAVIDKANVCVHLRASYIGPVNNDDQPGFEISTKLSDRKQIIARTRHEVTTDGMYFATDCGSTGVKPLTGNVVFQAFYTALGVGKIWGNPVGVTIPSDFWTRGVEVELLPFDRDNDLINNSLTIHARISYGRQPLRFVIISSEIITPLGNKTIQRIINNVERDLDGIFNYTFTDALFRAETGKAIVRLNVSDASFNQANDSQTYVWNRTRILTLSPRSIIVDGQTGQSGVYTLTLQNIVIENTDITLSDSSWVTMVRSGNTITLTTTSANTSADSRSLTITVSKQGLTATATFTQQSDLTIVIPTISFVGSIIKTIAETSGQSADYEISINNPSNIVLSLMIIGPQVTLDQANQRWNVADWAHATIVIIDGKTYVRLTSKTSNSSTSNREVSFQAGIQFTFRGNSETRLTRTAIFRQLGQEPEVTPPVLDPISNITLSRFHPNSRNVQVTIDDGGGTLTETLTKISSTTFFNVSYSSSTDTITASTKTNNDSFTERREQYRLTITNSVGSDFKLFTVIQSAAPRPTPPTISVNPDIRQLLSNTAGSSYTFSISVTNASINNVFILQASVPDWLDVSLSSNQLTLTTKTTNASTDFRDADVGVSVDTANPAYARVRQSGTELSNYAPIIKHLNPANGIIVRTNNLSFSATFTISIDARPSTITDYDINDLSAGAWSTINYNNGTITANISTNENLRERNTGIQIRLRNSEDWGNWLALEVRQPRKPVVPPTIVSLTPPNAMVGRNQGDTTSIIVDFTNGGGDVTGTITYISGVQNVFSVTYTTGSINIRAITTNISTSSRTARFKLTLTNSAGSAEREFNVQQSPAPQPTISLRPTTRQEIPYTGGSVTFTIELTGTTIDNVSIVPSSLPNWLTADIVTSSSNLIITADPNTGAEREHDIRLALGTGQSTLARIRQLADIRPFIEVDPDIFNVAYNETNQKESTITLQNASLNQVTIGTTPSWLNVYRENDTIFLQPSINNQRNNQQRGTDVILSVTANSLTARSTITFIQRGIPCSTPSITRSPNTIEVERTRNSSGNTLISVDDGNCDAVALFVLVSGNERAFSLEYRSGTIRAIANQDNNSFSTITNSYNVAFRNAAGTSDAKRFSVVQLGKPQPTISLRPTTSITNRAILSYTENSSVSFTIQLTGATIEQVGITGTTPVWLTAEINTTTSQLIVTAKANTGPQREGVVTIFINAGNTPSVTAFIRQSTNPVSLLSVSPVSWNPTQSSQSQNFTITGATSTPTISESATWLSISNKSSTGFTATVTANSSGSERNTTISISVSPTRSVSVSVRQSASISASISPSGVITITPASGELTKILAYTIRSRDLNKIGIRVNVNWVTLSTISRTGGFTATVDFRRVNLVTGIALATIDVINTDDNSVLTTATILIS